MTKEVSSLPRRVADSGDEGLGRGGGRCRDKGVNRGRRREQGSSAVISS